MSAPPDLLSAADRSTLFEAFERLDHPSFAIRLCNVMGTPVALALKLLPASWYKRIHRHAEFCLAKALDLSILLAPTANKAPVNTRRHTWLGMASGAVGGLFGGPAMLVEMPISTTLMLSAIAAIAQSEGEDLNSVDTRLACLTVFALGGRSDADDAADIGYYGLRLALEAPVAEASKFLARSRLAAPGPGQAPALIGLIHAIAKRFGVVLSEKAVAEMIPIIGAAGGALSNRIFMEHFQDMARCHFAIRRLERKYSPALIQDAYHQIKQQRLTFSPLPVYRQTSLEEPRLA
ncbi:MAG: EcsC family protein [Methylococcaceae bacterium]|jgi:hypothetical protein|nr:EcsC family protein [Methylococcaceae bacterium]